MRWWSISAFATLLTSWHCAREKRSRYITPLLDKQRQHLGALMTRRRQLVDMRVAEMNHLEQAGPRAVRSIKAVSAATPCSEMSLAGMPPGTSRPPWLDFEHSC
jgi:hypothetical protein